MQLVLGSSLVYHQRQVIPRKAPGLEIDGTAPQQPGNGGDAHVAAGYSAGQNAALGFGDESAPGQNHPAVAADRKSRRVEKGEQKGGAGQQKDQKKQPGHAHRQHLLHQLFHPGQIGQGKFVDALSQDVDGPPGRYHRQHRRGDKVGRQHREPQPLGPYCPEHIVLPAQGHHLVGQLQGLGLAQTEGHRVPAVFVIKGHLGGSQNPVMEGAAQLYRRHHGPGDHLLPAHQQPLLHRDAAVAPVVARRPPLQQGKGEDGRQNDKLLPQNGGQSRNIQGQQGLHQRNNGKYYRQSNILKGIRKVEVGKWPHRCFPPCPGSSESCWAWSN